VSEGFPVEVLDVIEIVATLLFTVEYALRYFSTPEATEVTKILTSGALGNIYPPNGDLDYGFEKLPSRHQSGQPRVTL